MTGPEHYAAAEDLLDAASTAIDPRCGTYAGWNVHKRQGTPVCEGCRSAQTVYVRNLRTRKGERFNFPLAGNLPDLGLGSALARGFRESA